MSWLRFMAFSLLLLIAYRLVGELLGIPDATWGVVALAMLSAKNALAPDSISAVQRSDQGGGIVSNDHVFQPDEQSECNECGRGPEWHPVAADGWMRYSPKSKGGDS